MSPGLLAPQFGFGRTSLSDLDAQSGPTVTVKRRRLVETPGGTGAGEQPQAPPEAKLSKVYRLEAPQVGVPNPTPEPVLPEPLAAAAVAIQGLPEAPPTSKPRRRKDLVRKPTLVRHEVFETSSSAVLPGQETPTTANADVSRMDVFQAMKRMSETLDAVVRAHEAYVALDEHLKVLGI